jgi:hypothetical protein
MSSKDKKQYIPENHINTSPKNIYKMESNNEPTVVKKQRLTKEQKEQKKLDTEIKKIIDNFYKIYKKVDKMLKQVPTRKTIKSKTASLNTILNNITYMKNLIDLLNEIGYNTEDTMNGDIDVLLSQYDLQWNSLNEPKAKSQKKEVNELDKELVRLNKKFYKIKIEIENKLKKIETLKTIKGKQNALTKLLQRIKEMKNVVGILQEMSTHDENNIEFINNNMIPVINNLENKINEPNKLNIYNQYINALLFVAGYDLNTGNDDDIRMMSYYLEQVFPEIIKYNVYNINKSQATKILEDIRKYIEDTDNDTHFKILESLDTTNVTKTLPNEKKQALLDTLGTMESPLIDLQYEPMPKPLVLPQAKPILLKKRKMPTPRTIILEDIPIYEPIPKKKYTIPTDLQVINIDEHVPSIIPKDKEITIKRKPKTPVKKKRSYKEMKEATVKTYIKNGYEHTRITYKDGEVIEKKRKLTQEEIDNLPVEKPHIYLTELDKYLNKITNYDTSELKQEFTNNGIKMPSGKNDIELIDILKKLYIKLHKDTYDKHILI